MAPLSHPTWRWRGSLALLCTYLAAAQSIPDELLFHKLVLPLSTPPTACNDGTPYAFFYRNCTGNWDRHEGDPDFCVVPNTRWLVVFGELLGGGGSGAFCYDSASCASRAQNLTSSSSVPATAWANGAVIPFAEVNPNLYLQHSVVAPYCSSDLFGGDGSTASVGDTTFGFNGRGIVDAVLAALFSNTSGVSSPNAALADSFLLVGPAGVMARIDELADALRALKRAASRNDSAVLDVFGVCDGCLLFSNLTAPADTPMPCTTDSNCPPVRALPALSAMAGLGRPAWCSDAVPAWACFTSSPLLGYLRTASTPVLVSSAQYNARGLASYGVQWPAVGAGLVWAQTVFAPAVRSATTTAVYGVTSACPAPQVSLAGAYYHTLVPHTDALGRVHNDSLGTAVPLFLEAAAVGEGGGGPGAFGRWGDDCGAFAGCNPSGCAD